MLEKHPLSDAKKFFCEICGYSSNTKSYLSNHRRDKHDKKFKHNCPCCDSKFPSKQKKNIHIDRNHPEFAEENFACEICGKNFIYADTLKHHSHYHCSKNPKLRRKIPLKKQLDLKRPKTKLETEENEN